MSLTCANRINCRLTILPRNVGIFFYSNGIGFRYMDAAPKEVGWLPILLIEKFSQSVRLYTYVVSIIPIFICTNEFPIMKQCNSSPMVSLKLLTDFIVHITILQKLAHPSLLCNHMF